MRGRPTTDPKHYRINLRINEETYRNLESICRQNGLTVAEYVRFLISSNDLTLSPEEKRLLKDIFNMARLSGISRKEFLCLLDEELTNGTIVVENGGIKRGSDL